MSEDHTNPLDGTPFGPVLEGILARNEARFAAAAAPPSSPPPDPKAEHRRWLGDRIAVLREGEFPPRLVDRIEIGSEPETLLKGTPALNHGQRFEDADKTILVLSGGTGSGKTLSASHVAMNIGGSRPGFVRSTRFERLGRYDKDMQAWLDSRTMLVLDDVGVEFLDSKGAYLSLLDELIDVAWGRKSRIVMTTNLDPKAFAERVGRRVWSRIADVGIVARCGDVDLRRPTP